MKMKLIVLLFLAVVLAISIWPKKQKCFHYEEESFLRGLAENEIYKCMGWR